MTAKFLLLVLFFLSTCKKVPLENDAGVFTFSSAHYFESEKTVYVFFEVTELPERLEHAFFEMNFQSYYGLARAYEKIDFTKGVHEHELVKCSDRSLCGSYSFKSERQIHEVGVRLRYSSESDLNIEQSIPVNVHSYGYYEDTAISSFNKSAVLYGVFDKGNSKMQVRVLDNFSSPSDSDISRFGMKRKFRVSNFNFVSISSLQDTYNCGEFEGADILELQGRKTAWVNKEFSPEDVSPSVCFGAKLLNKENVEIDRLAGVGFRNPVIAKTAMTMRTPLSETKKIPVVLSYCTDNDYSAKQVNQEFLDYQRFIVGFQDQPTDLCFKVGRENEFKQDLQALLAKKLTEAKADNPSEQDLAFVVILHHNFTREFQIFHKTLAANLKLLVENERTAITPRLSGAFVYDSSTDFSKANNTSPQIMWCPRELPPETKNTVEMANENCTNLPGSGLDLQFINFVAPMGPFPSLRNFSEYTQEYGHVGLARSPKFSLKAVQKSPLTVDDGRNHITFFEATRLDVSADQYIHLCHERDTDKILPSLRFKPASSPREVPSLTSDQIEEIWRNPRNDDTYSLGLVWEYPFWGAIEYDAPVSGKLVSVIPFQRSFSQTQSLAEKRWRTPSWDLGQLMDRCIRYCNHPFFDEMGVYQLGMRWDQDRRCTRSVYPIPE
jgi:hypothetical protein